MLVKKRVKWLCFEYTRIGYVDELRFFGHVFYSKCGVINRLFGVEWRND